MFSARSSLQLPVLHLQVKEHLVGDEAGEAGFQETEPLADLAYRLYVLVVELAPRRGLLPSVEQFVGPVQDGEHFRQAGVRPGRTSRLFVGRLAEPCRADDIHLPLCHPRGYLQHLAVLQVGELAVHQAVHGDEHLAAFLQRLRVDGDSRLVGGGAEDIECDGEAEGLVDERLDGGHLTSPFRLVVAVLCCDSI